MIAVVNDIDRDGTVEAVGWMDVIALLKIDNRVTL